MSRTAQRIREEAAAAEDQLLQLATATAPTPAPAEPAANVEPSDDPTPAPPPPPAPQPSALEREYAELKHRHETLQGMFARQGADTQTLQQQLAQVQQQLQQLTAASPRPPEPTTTGRVTAKDREEYGDALIDLIRRVAQEATHVPLATHTARLDRLESAIKTAEGKAVAATATAEELAAEKFYNALTQLHPDWETVNESQEWLTWLAGHDAMSGVRRDELLQRAHKSLNVRQVAAIFTAFKTDTGKSGTASGGAKSGEPRIDPKSIVTPSAAATPSQNANSPGVTRGKTFTGKDLDKLYDDYTKGKIDAATFKQREAEIHLAAAEGRLLL